MDMKKTISKSIGENLSEKDRILSTVLSSGSKGTKVSNSRHFRVLLAAVIIVAVMLTSMVVVIAKQTKTASFTLSADATVVKDGDVEVTATAENLTNLTDGIYGFTVDVQFDTAKFSFDKATGLARPGIPEAFTVECNVWETNKVRVLFFADDPAGSQNLSFLNQATDVFTLTFKAIGNVEEVGAFTPLNLIIADAESDENDTKIEGSFEKIGISPALDPISVTIEAAVQKYDVTFDANGGTPVTKMSDEAGEIIQLPSTSKANNTLAGWTNADNSVFLPAGADYEVTDANVELKAVWVDLAMLKGADIRMLSPTGLRFCATIDEDNFADITAASKSAVSMGTLICPDSYIAGAVEFTAASLTANSKRFLDIKRTVWIDSEVSGSYQLGAAITSLDAANYTLDFAGRSYITFQYTNNVTTTLYADYIPGNASAGGNARSIQFVARAAITAGGYSGPELTILEGFAGGSGPF